MGKKSLAGLGLGLALLGGCGPELREDTERTPEPQSGTVSQGLTNVLVNGSFEQAPSLGFSNYITLSSGEPGLTGWVVQSGVMLMSNTYKTPAQGTRSIGLPYGSVSQTFPTVAGNGYTVQFSLATSPACATSSRTVDVSVNGTTYNFSTSSATWASRNFVFNASGSTATIVFKNSYTGQTCGPAIDNVSVMGP
jgi:choice-of-anchor C domain-containing protein